MQKLIGKWEILPLHNRKSCNFHLKAVYPSLGQEDYPSCKFFVLIHAEETSFQIGEIQPLLHIIGQTHRFLLF